jgi:hypothetical protein
MLYEQDMNEEAYHNGSGMDLVSRTSDEKHECMGYDSNGFASHCINIQAGGSFDLCLAFLGIHIQPQSCQSL